jgi:hypothetical protein
MMRIRAIQIVVIVTASLMLALLHCSKKGSEPGEGQVIQSEAAIPAIDSLFVNSAGPEDTIWVFGTGFGDQRDTSDVICDTTPCHEYYFWSDTLVVAGVPASGVTTGIRILVDGELSKEFPVNPCYIYSIIPTYGKPGTVVSIHGFRFGNQSDSQSVTFDSSAVEAVSWSDTLVVVEVPADLPVGKYIVRVCDYSSAEFRITDGSPGIDRIVPEVGMRGDTVSIIGWGFGDEQGNSSISYDWDTCITELSW